MFPTWSCTEFVTFLFECMPCVPLGLFRLPFMRHHLINVCIFCTCINYFIYYSLICSSWPGFYTSRSESLPIKHWDKSFIKEVWGVNPVPPHVSHVLTWFKLMQRNQIFLLWQFWLIGTNVTSLHPFFVGVEKQTKRWWWGGGVVGCRRHIRIKTRIERYIYDTVSHP